MAPPLPEPCAWLPVSVTLVRLIDPLFTPIAPPPLPVDVFEVKLELVIVPATVLAMLTPPPIVALLAVKVELVIESAGLPPLAGASMSTPPPTRLDVLFENVQLVMLTLPYVCARPPPGTGPPEPEYVTLSV